MDNIFKDKWRPGYVCSECSSIDSFDGAYITCKCCGCSNGNFKSVRDIYKIKVFFKFIKIRIHLKTEIK